MSNRTERIVQNYALDIPNELWMGEAHKLKDREKNHVNTFWGWRTEPKTLIVSNPIFAEKMFRSEYDSLTGTYGGLYVLIGAPEHGNKLC